MHLLFCVIRFYDYFWVLLELSTPFCNSPFLPGGTQLFESTLESETSVFYKTKSPTYFHTLSIFHGRGWVRTTEAEKQQIYSLSPLATREHAHILFAVIADCLYILSSEVAFVNYFFHGFSLFLSFSIFLRFTAIKALPITAKTPKRFPFWGLFGAGDRSWTCNPLITNQLRCHCAPPASVT